MYSVIVFMYEFSNNVLPSVINNMVFFKEDVHIYASYPTTGLGFISCSCG